MKRLCLLSSLAIAVGFVLPDAARAQDTVTRAGVVARTPSYASLMSALTASSTAAEKLPTFTTLTAEQVRLVDATTLITEVNEDAFAEALGRHEEDLKVLRNAVTNTMVITKLLGEHAAKPSVDDVIAVDVSEPSDIVVYYRKS